jgi:YggT family protein
MGVIFSLILNTLYFLILAHVILSYFMPPIHPVRQAIDRIIAPLIDPIRQILPPIGGLDFSPLVLILVIRLLSNLLASSF